MYSSRGQAHRVSEIVVDLESALMARSKDRGAAPMKLLRIIRLDPSDTFIFPSAAELGEWAISGAFVFSNVARATLEGRELAAFPSGCLGMPCLARSGQPQVLESNAEGRHAAIDL